MFHLFLFLLTLYYVEASIDWSYAEQTNWYQKYSECGGSRQSPIDISPDLLVLNTSTKVEWINFAHSSTEYEVVNNGHTVQFNYKGQEKSVPKIRGLNGGTYDLVQFHIHWGMVHLVGSEHTINGKRFDMEFHMVFFNRDKYPDYQTALDSHQDGVLVLAVFYEIQRANAPELTNFLRVVGKFSRNPISETEFALKLEDFVPRHKGSAQMEMFMYSGSFTTPPCTEGITWLLVPKPNPIGEQQIVVLRSIRDILHHQKEGNNYRYIQPNNGRLVQWFRI